MTAMLAILVWLAAVYRRPPANRREPGAWALSATLAALALGLTLKVPAVYAAVEDVSSVANLAQLIKDACVVLSAFGTQVVLLHLLHAPALARARVRRRALVAVLAVTVMAAAFLLARPVGGLNELRADLAAPGLVEFRGVYLLFLVWAFVDIARLCWRFARLAGDTVLALGLRLIAAGGVVGLGYAASGAVQMLAAGRRDLSLVQQTQHTSDALIALATLLVVLGSTLPALAARLGRQPQASPAPAPAMQMAPADLHALWAGVTRALPEFVLPPAAREGLTGQEQLYRQVIEIEDARLALRPLRDAAVEQAAAQAVAQHGLDEREHDAAVEGVALALAMDRLRTEDAPLAMPTGLSSAAPPLLALGDLGLADSLGAEVTWLSSVGRWYGDDSLTATARRLLAGSHRPAATHQPERAHGRAR